MDSVHSPGTLVRSFFLNTYISSTLYVLSLLLPIWSYKKLLLIITSFFEDQQVNDLSGRTNINHFSIFVILNNDLIIFVNT